MSKNPLTVLITGKSGSGKSSLIHSLVERKVAKKSETQLTQLPTHEIQGYNGIHSHVNFVAIHSSELQDADQDDETAIGAHKQELVRICPAVDLAIYCIDMTAVRIDSADKAAFQHLTDCFSPAIWKKGIITLTFANELKPPRSFKGNYEEYFDHRLSQFKNVIQKMLLDVNVPQNIVQKIPIIPTGYLNDNFGQQDWFSNFWSLFVTRIEGGACCARLNLQPNTNRTRIVSTMSIGALVGAAIGVYIGSPVLGYILSAGTGAVFGFIIALFGCLLFFRNNPRK